MIRRKVSLSSSRLTSKSLNFAFQKMVTTLRNVIGLNLDEGNGCFGKSYIRNSHAGRIMQN